MPTRRLALVRLLVTLALLFPTYPSGQVPTNAAPASPQADAIQLLTHAGGSLLEVALQGNYAYLGHGTRLAVLDVTDPTQPALLGQSQHLTSTISSIVMSGTLAYVAATYAGLRVFDVSNPAAPVEVGSYQTPGQAESVAIMGHYAYLADRSNGLYVIDVADPAHPALVQVLPASGNARCVTIEGHYAYLLQVSSSGGTVFLKIYDTSDPANPIYAGEHWLQNSYGPPAVIAVVGTTAYVAASGLYILDVADPANVTELGSYEPPAFGCRDVAVADGYAYVVVPTTTTYDFWLYVVDVHNPADPVEVGTFPVAGHLHSGPAISGTLAYLPDGAFGLHVLDLTNPAAPAPVGFYSTLPPATEVAVDSGYAYVLDGYKGLHILDVHDPTNPARAGAFAGAGTHTYMQIALAGDYGYLTVYESLLALDIADPSQPRLTGTFTMPMSGSFYALAVAGNYAYLGNYSGAGFVVVDVSNPSDPVLAGQSSACGGHVLAVAVVGTLAYLGTTESGLCIMDVTNPALPVRIGAFDPGGTEFWSIAVEGSYAYAGDDATIYIVSVADPAQPVEVATFTGSGAVNDIVTTPGFVFFTDATGLNVVDVSDATHPSLAGHWGLTIDSQLALDGATVYVAASKHGLYVLRFTPDGPNKAFVPVALRN